MVLEDYKKIKDKLVNPLDSKFLGLINKISWTNLYPELLWIAVILYKNRLNKTELKYDLESTSNLIYKITSFFSVSGYASDFGLISFEKWDEFKKILISEELSNIQELFVDLIVIFPKCNFIKIYNQLALDSINRDFEKSLRRINLICTYLDDKHSEFSVYVIGIFILNLVKLGRIKNFGEGCPECCDISKLNITNFSLCGSIYRASLWGISGFIDSKSSWCSYYYKQGVKYNCYLLKEEFPNICSFGDDNPIKQDINLYSQSIHLANLFNKYIMSVENSLDFNKFNYKSDRFCWDQVIIGLVYRELNFIRKILSNVTIWEQEIIRIMYRVLLDNHILLLWFLKNGSEEIAEKYIDVGIGNIKLYTEKLKFYSKDMHTKRMKAAIEDAERKVAMETNPIIQDISLSQKWTDKSTRELAISIDRKELFDMYDILSDVVHANWQHIMAKYMKFCPNPFHNRHKIPKKVIEEYDYVFVFSTCKILGELIPIIKNDLKLEIYDFELIELNSYENQFFDIFLYSWRD